MAAILMFPWPLSSHALATLKTARTLRSAGHTIVYASLGVENPVVRENGFAQEVLLSDLLPNGLLPVFANRTNRQVNRFMRANLPEFVRRLEGALDELVSKYRFDLTFVDRNHAYAALPLYGRGVAPVLVWATLPTDRRPGVPPLTSPSLPARTVFGRLRVALEWTVLSAVVWTALYSSRLPVLYQALARRYGFPRERMTRGPIGLNLQLPQIIACPKCFDIAPAPDPLRHYLGPCIDLERQQPAFDWTRLESGRKLAYCALGTSGHSYQGAMAFLERVVEALRNLHGWQAVLAAGDFEPVLAEKVVRESIPHVAVVRDAPQLEMLKRADVMLTHGGLGSIKECLFFGVPIVVFPGSGDQIGNGARVAYHEVGGVGDLRRSSADEIRALMTRVASSDVVRRNVVRMQREFVTAERDEPLHDLVAQVIASSRQPAASHHAWNTAVGGLSSLENSQE